LFSDLKTKIELEWVPEMIPLLEMSPGELPLMWNADFFIKSIDGQSLRYSLCEINVGCISLFPECDFLYG
jgi:hypothetical protein